MEETRKHGVMSLVLDLLDIQNQRISSLEQGITSRLSTMERRISVLEDAMKLI